MLYCIYYPTPVRDISEIRDENMTSNITHPCDTLLRITQVCDTHFQPIRGHEICHVTHAE